MSGARLVLGNWRGGWGGGVVGLEVPAAFGAVHRFVLAQGFGNGSKTLGTDTREHALCGSWIRCRKNGDIKSGSNGVPSVP